MKRITIVPQKKAVSLIPEIVNRNSLCYYLADDYEHFIELRNKCGDKIKIRNLSGIFQETFKEIKGPFLELTAKLNKKYASLDWWGGQLASRSTSATPLLLNITYLFCVKKILSDSYKDVIFIVNSHALSDCISNVAMKAGYQVVSYRTIINKCLGIIRLWLYHAAQITYFFWQVLQSRGAAFKLLKPLPAKKSHAKKRIVIRSWITKGNFNKSGKFKDRNFGPLPAWLCSKNYEVWTLPMFFNLSMKIKEVYALMKDQAQPFLIPDHYIKFSDYSRVLYSRYQMLRRRIENVEINKTNIVPIFNEVMKESGFVPSLLILNLCCPMLKRLKERGFEIDGFYYPFENNAPEKPFILGVRRYFPDSEIVAYQHTVWYPDQLAMFLSKDEVKIHPIADQIICSGPIYLNILKDAGFPYEILKSGPNLRFTSVYNSRVPEDEDTYKQKIILLPLSFDKNLAYELIFKVKVALENTPNYSVCIRTHPLLSKGDLNKFLSEIKMTDFKFADDGVIQDWLLDSYAVISTGGTVAILESVVMGIPVIRVIPDNTFFYDPLAWSSYPIKPVNSALEIRNNLHLTSKMLKEDKHIFHEIGKQVLFDYFTQVDDNNLKVFL